MWNKKYKAFTLYEMLISMTVTALLVPLIWSGWNLVTKQIQLFKSTQNQILEARTFQQYLLRDIEKYESWTFKDKELIFSSKEEGSMKYQFLETLTIRYNQHLDTFHFATKIERLDLLDPNVEMIKNCELSIRLFNQNHRIQLVKTFSADELIKTMENGY